MKTVVFVASLAVYVPLAVSGGFLLLAARRMRRRGLMTVYGLVTGWVVTLVSVAEVAAVLVLGELPLAYALAGAGLLVAVSVTGLVHGRSRVRRSGQVPRHDP